MIKDNQESLYKAHLDNKDQEVALDLLDHLDHLAFLKKRAHAYQDHLEFQASLEILATLESWDRKVKREKLVSTV